MIIAEKTININLKKYYHYNHQFYFDIIILQCKLRIIAFIILNHLYLKFRI